MRLVGVLMGYAANDPVGLARLAALHEGLEELGWLEGSNLKIETRFAGADPARCQTSSELVGLRPDLIVANTAAVLAGLRNETRTVPLIFVLLRRSSRLRVCFKSSSRPGGNVAGYPPTKI